MKIAYNPTGGSALSKSQIDSLKNDIIFDLSGMAVYARGIPVGKVYLPFEKSTSSTTEGYNGLVPFPDYNGNSKTRFLREDGTWVVPTNTNNYRPISVNGTSILENNNTALNLVAGTNITLSPEKDSNNKYTGKVTITANAIGIKDLSGTSFSTYLKSSITYGYNSDETKKDNIVGDFGIFNMQTSSYTESNHFYFRQFRGQAGIDKLYTRLYYKRENEDIKYTDWKEILKLGDYTTLAGYGITDAVKNVSNASADVSESCVGYTTSGHNKVNGGMFTALGETGLYGSQLLGGYSGQNLYYRGKNNGDWTEWKEIAFKATTIQGYGLWEKYTDLNNVPMGAFFSGGKNVANSPYSGEYISGITLARDINKDYRTQLSFAGPRIFIRQESGANNWGNWHEVAFTDSNITGNAASATKLQTARKIWGQSFDGSGNVDGLFTLTNTGGNGKPFKIGWLNDATENPVLNMWSYDYSLGGFSDMCLGVSSDVVPQGSLYFNSSTKQWGIGTDSPTQKLDVNGNIKATSFIGNLDGSYINKLTGYTKATTISAITANDTLNAALGKLEFKTDFIYNDLFGTDNDDIINKWHEIVDFVDSVAESTDITEEFVTRKTELTIIGAKTFSGTSATILTVDRNADKPTYIAFKNKGTLKGYLGIDSSEKPVYTNSSAGISYLLHSGNYTNYKHSYTNLTGSTTTANQAIVSNGTKDGWKLLTLGPGAFLDDYPMLNLGTLSDYVEYVLLLHPINDSTDWQLYYSYGTIYTHRSNGLSPCSSIIYNSISKYNSTDVYVSMILQGRKYAQWCTCTYNRLKYCGLKLYTLANHSSDLTIKGRWNSDPVLVKYKTNQKTDSNGNITSKEIIHNEEIANSIVVEGDDIIIKSTHGKFNGTFEGNITGGTVGSVLYQSTADITSFLNPPSTESILTSNGGVPYWTSLVSVRGYIGTTAVQSTSTNQALTGITSLNMSENINILSGNSDRYITFGYSNNAFTSADAYSWRLGYIGSGEGNANYFKIQSSHGNTWTDVLKLGLLTYEATFSGNIIASGNVTASKFITTGGTASQFVKGDGSLDSTSYVTTTTLENYVTKTEFPNLASKGLYKILTSSGGSNINKWKKFARINLSSDNVYTQCGGYMFIYDHEGHRVKGILDFHVRTVPDTSINNSNINLQSPYLKWHILDDSNYASNIKMVKVENGIFDLYITTSQLYTTFVILVFTPRSDKITLFDETWIDTLPETVIATSRYAITVPNATTATKLANTLTFNAGTFAAKTYNGSSAVTVNIPTHTSHLTNDSFAVHNAAVKNVTSLTRSTLGYAYNSGANADTFWHDAGPVAIFGVSSYSCAILASAGNNNVIKYKKVVNGSAQESWKTFVNSDGTQIGSSVRPVYVKNDGSVAPFTLSNATANDTRNILVGYDNGIYLVTSAKINPYTGILTANGFVKSGSSSSYVLLGDGGHKALSDFLLETEFASKELGSNLTTITKTLVVSKDWVDTGIVFDTATFPNGTGSYIVQLSRDDLYYWTGCLSIVISNNVTAADSDEILLHGGGFDTGIQYYLRTVHDTTNKVVKLQIARNNTYSTSKTYTFKFKKLI